MLLVQIYLKVAILYLPHKSTLSFDYKKGIIKTQFIGRKVNKVNKPHPHARVARPMKFKFDLDRITSGHEQAVLPLWGNRARGLAASLTTASSRY